MLKESKDESKKLTDGQLQKELDFFLSCDDNFRALFYRLLPDIEAWKKIRVYFDFYLQQEVDNKEVKEATAENVDFSDLPVYDEEYTTVMKH